MNVGLADTPDGRRIEVARRVDAPREDCWDLLRDTTRWPDWGPTVREVECPTRYVEAGTTGRVRTVAGWVPFEVTTCADYRWTWTVGAPESARFLNALDLSPRVPATGHRVDAVTERVDGRTRVAPDACRVVFEVPLWGVGYVPVCERALGTIARLVTEPGA